MSVVDYKFITFSPSPLFFTGNVAGTECFVNITLTSTIYYNDPLYIMLDGAAWGTYSIGNGTITIALSFPCTGAQHTLHVYRVITTATDQYGNPTHQISETGDFTFRVPPAVVSGFSTSLQTTSSSRLSWNVVSNAVSYKIYNVSRQLVASPTTNYYNLTSLPSNSENTFFVRAVNADGQESLADTQVKVYPKPVAPTVTVPIVRSWQMIASVPPIGTYITTIFYFNGASFTGTSGTYTNNSIAANTMYGISAKYRTLDGAESAMSTTVNVASLPETPTNLAASGVTAVAFNLSWGFPVGYSSYRLYLNGTFYNTFSGAPINNISFPQQGKSCSVQLSAYGSFSNESEKSPTITVYPIVITNPPTIVSLTSTQSDFTLQWEPVAAASHYIVNVNDVDVTPSVTSTSVTLPFSDFTAATVVKVKAANDSGHSPYTAPQQIVPQVPPTPVIIAPTIGQSIDAPVTLSWNAVTQAPSYTVQASNTDQFAALIVNQTLSETSYEALELAPGVSYYWRIRATNIGGNSDWSVATFFSITQDIPPVPLLVSPVNQIAASDLPIILTWQSSYDADSYNLQIADNPSFITRVLNQAGLTGHTYQVSIQLNYETEYYWRVSATNEVGTSDWSDGVFFHTPSDTPVAPTIPLFSATSEYPLILAWNQTNNTLDYDVQVASDDQFANIISAASATSIPVGTEQHQINASAGLIRGARYYWRVRANNIQGSGNWSEIQSIIPALLAPKASIPVPDSVDQPIAPTLRWAENVFQALPGDIAIVRVNSSTSGFSFVALTDIPVAAGIKWTDNGWQTSGGFRPGETTAMPIDDTAVISKGTVINIATTGFSLVGDQVFLFAGNHLSTNMLDVKFIYGVTWGSGTGWTNATDPNTSALPATLSLANLALGNTPYWQYNGTLTGTKQELLTSINNPINWTDSSNSAWSRGTFTVVPDSAPITYDLQVAPTSFFNNPIVEEVGLPTEMYEMIPTTLDQETQYWWRVRSKTSYTVSEWSQIASFTTEVVLANVSGLVVDVGVSTPDSIGVIWDAVPNATHYRINYKTSWASPYNGTGLTLEGSPANSPVVVSINDLPDFEYPSLLFEGAIAQVPYWFEVTAIKDAYESTPFAYTGNVTPTGSTLPATMGKAPEKINTVYNRTTNEITINWEPNE